MVIWLVSREYAGIAEAGGVKNVACSLCENLVQLGNKVILFIPFYGCTDISHVESFNKNSYQPVQVYVLGKRETVQFASGTLAGVEFVFICHKAFKEKKAVYTYTEEEEKKNPLHKRGTGHEDSLYLNSLFQKAVAAFGKNCAPDQLPDIVHCQDATTALVPAFIQQIASDDMEGSIAYSHTKCVVTIHNAGPGYHHEFSSLREAELYTGLPENVLSKGLNGTKVEPFLVATANAKITTVSPQYAQEILLGTTETAGLTEGFRNRHTEIEGITNGIEFSKYDPSDIKKSLLPYAFNPVKKDLVGKYKCRHFLLEEFATMPEEDKSKVHNDVPVIEQCGHIETGSASDPCEPVFIVYHGRIVRQKGIDILAASASKLLEGGELVRFIFIGQGEPELENELELLSKKFPGKCIFLRGYERALARLCTAAADFIVLPSQFEPCGLEDFIAQLYGTIPVAHATGGLCKIVDEQTGYLYHPNTPEELSSIIHSLVQLKQADGDLFNNMIAYTAQYVKNTYSWRIVAKEKYMKLYHSLLSEKKKK